MGCLESGGLASYWGSVLEGIRNVGVFLSRRFFPFFCGNFSLFGKRIRKEISPKNSLVSSFRDFFNLFFTLHVVLRNHGNSNCRDGCINLSNHLSGGDEILNAWETEMVRSGTTVEY